jgi:predicted dehydrogenase
MLKIGVFGAGHLGKIHIRCLKGIAGYELVGFHDPNPELGSKVAKDLDIPYFPDGETLMSMVDVVDIVTPTQFHFPVAKTALLLGKHCFIEKPVTSTLEEAEELLSIQKKTGLKIQIGHVERFNPAFLALKKYDLNPMFLEVHRLAEFKPRGTEVPVVLDLMIHDLDLILHLVKSEVKNVYASEVTVVSPSPDICNARIEFENGAVANVTASRLSLKVMRKMRLFQPDAYISLDFAEKNVQVIRMLGKDQPIPEDGLNFGEIETASGPRTIHATMPIPEDTNAIQMELDLFRKSIEENKPEEVSLADGYKALSLAFRVLEASSKSSIKPSI